MQTYYIKQSPQQTIKQSVKERQQIELVTTEGRTSEPELVKIYHSLKKNFNPRNFSLFDDDPKPERTARLKSLSRRKLEQIKLPKIPRIRHGDSRQPKTQRKQLPAKQDSVVQLVATLRRKSSFINKVFNRHEMKKRTNSEISPIGSKIMSLANPNETLKRKTGGLKSRKASLRELQKPKEPYAIIRPPKILTCKEILLELDPLEEKQFLSVMRHYSYVKLANNTPILGFYKAYIGPGNNSELIKRTLKARCCWTIVDQYDPSVNLVWTQLKHTDYCETLEQRSEEGQVEIVNSGSAVMIPTNNLLQQFMSSRLNEFPFLLTAQSIMDKDYFRGYLNRILVQASRGICRSHDYSRLAETIQRRRPKLPYHQITNPHNSKMHNHVDSASTLGNKKALFYYMKKYYQHYGKDPFQVLPNTVHILGGSRYTEQELKQMIPFELPCILKPGENTNRGNGITIHTDWKSLSQAVQTIRHSPKSSLIVQRYLRPFLYKSRKFDIRVWVLWNGKVAWWYKEGYIRTSCKQFNIKDTNKFIHLTNDAVQKYCDDYGKYEQGNKLSWNEFQKYLDLAHPKLNFWTMAYSEMKRIAADVFTVGNQLMDPKKKLHSYQLFGLDFMLDDNFKVWLIEVNTNPCLQTSCNLLTRLVTNMVDNVVSVAVDTVFPPPEGRRRSSFSFQNTFRFELLVDGHSAKNDKIFYDKRRFDSQQNEEEEQPPTDV